MKLYHYSPHKNLDVIDPAYYATSGKNISPEYRQGHKHLVPRSYFYTEDRPESVVSSGRHRYEVWMPKDFKVYDLGQDPENIVELTHKESGLVGNGLYDLVEHKIKERGYHGYHNSKSPLAHVTAMFHPIKVEKQHAHPHSYDWHDDGSEDPQSEEPIKKEELDKGVMRRLAPFNPKEPAINTGKIDAWQNELAARHSIPEMIGNERVRALHTLSGQAKTRRHPKTGERMFLLHRGTSPNESPELHHKNRYSSWTPSYWSAHDFADRYTPEFEEGKGKIHSYWIPESKIHSVPKQYGDFTGDGRNYFADEYEVIVKPNHGAIIAADNEFSPPDKTPPTLDESINDRAGRTNQDVQSSIRLFGHRRKMFVKQEYQDQLKGGIGDKKKQSDFPKEDLLEGVNVELEHTDDRKLALEIAIDHLSEDPAYYKKLKTIEKNLRKDTHPHQQAHGPTPPKPEVNEQAGGVGMDTFHPIMSGFGTITPGKKTNLKFYRDLEHHHDNILDHVKQQGYEPYFAGGKFGKPDLQNKNYNSKHLMIYDPTPESGGDFGNEKYTSAWRHAHELAHAQTYPLINKLYGEGRRLGKLGQRTPSEAKRAVHWEHLAAHKQREIMENLGYKVSDEDFNKEYNTVMGDAVHRAITGKFTEPSEMGFEPHSHKVDLKHALGLIDEHAKKLGLEHDHDTLADLRSRKSST